MILEEYLGHIDRSADQFAAAVEHGPLDAPVAACPGWDLRRLTVHMGIVHRWASAAAATGVRPSGGDAPDDLLDSVALAAWLRDGAEQLKATLAAIDPDGPTWHPFPLPKVGAIWPRRQAHETTVHRWDAEHAAGIDPAPIPIDLAADGVAEYLELAMPRVIVRENVDTLPAGRLHLACADTGDGWTLEAADGELAVRRVGGEFASADARVSGPAAAVLGALWRRDIDPAGVATTGDEAVAEAWLSLPGL